MSPPHPCPRVADDGGVVSLTDAELAWIDPDDMHRAVSERLAALPPTEYLRCLAGFMERYRQLHDAPGPYRRLVDDIVSLCGRAAAGERVDAEAGALDLEWSRLTFPDDDDSQPYAGPLDIELYKACSGALWELTDEAHRYDSADSIADGALHHEQPGDVLANVRLLLHFLDDASRAAPPASPAPFAPFAALAVGAPAMRRAGLSDLRAVLALLDETVAWLRGRGLQQWLLWPHERDTFAASLVRGEVWLLPDAGGIAATATMTAEPGPGTWSAEDRTVKATYVSRLAVRRDLTGHGIGGQILEWARDHAHRRGDAAVRVSAWPGNPFLDAYLQRQGFLYLWTVAGPLATSRTLFTRRAAPGR